jgi:hypothetical protein
MLVVQPCTKSNDTSMLCRMPELAIPPELQNISQTQGPARQKRSAPHELSLEQFALNYIGSDSDLDSQPTVMVGAREEQTLRRSKRSPVAQLAYGNVSIKVYLGFKMDRLQTLKNISRSKPELKLELIPITVKFEASDGSTAVPFDPDVNISLIIKVNMLTTYFVTFAFLLLLCVNLMEHLCVCQRSITDWVIDRLTCLLTYFRI